MKRAVFLDRDGVINKDLLTTKRLKIFPNAGRAVKMLNGLGFVVVVVTNQPQIAKGIQRESDIRKINKEIAQRLRKDGARIDAVYYCPHHPEKRTDIPDWARKYRIKCRCRKPDTGMLLKAKKKFDIDFSSSYLIGDRTVDIKCGKNIGCTTILVKTGHAGEDGKYDVKPDYICADIFEAAKFITAEEKADKNIKAIILAGGRGERLRPLTDKLPKPLIPINGKPVLWHQMMLLKKYGIRDIVICGHYLFDKIKKYFGNGKKFGVNITYVFEKEPLGTGGAIKNAERLIKNTSIVIYGDEMIEMDISRLLRFHKTKSGLATIVAHKTDHPEDSDLVEINKGGLVTGFFPKGSEKKGLKISKSSVYAIEPAAFKFIEDKCDFDRTVLPKLINKKAAFGYLTDEYIKDMGTFERYEQVRKRFGKTGTNGKTNKAARHTDDL
ncbi:MAG: HAD-IIIA family hydrolase [Candidatus Aenigmarchaeota archaeon]|nr:HAD-IIIA family hydrolase [Candidatus Aenigmarchaeota archaeon]